MQRAMVGAVASVLVWMGAAGVAHAAACAEQGTGDQLVSCRAVELREADVHINQSYQALAARLDSAGKIALRQSQLAWLRQRDTACGLKTRVQEREKWLQDLAQDEAKASCVMRVTRERIAELARMPSAPPAPLPAPAAPVHNNPDIAYDQHKATVHSSGKWYFELTLDYARAAAVGPSTLTLGVWDKHQLIGVMENIRATDGARPTVRLGIAVDLDNGKLYQRKDGAWQDGAPGSNAGTDVKLGREYYSTFILSAGDPAPYLQQQAIVPNFGDKPLQYALPDGYRPWREQR